MIFHDSYLDDCIQGTLDQRQWEIETQNNAIHIACNITIEYNGVTYSNLFEVPFFNKRAKLSISKYAHSLIVNNFQMPEINKTNIKVQSFDLADVTYEIKEMSGTTVLSTTSGTFHMTLGRINDETLILSDIEGNNTSVLLDCAQSAFLDNESIAAFTIIAFAPPTELISNDSLLDHSKALNTGQDTKYIHTITVPMSEIITNNKNAFSLRLKFSDDSELQLCSINIIDRHIENKMMAFQNTIGGLSIVHFYGEYIKAQRFRTKSDSFTGDFNHENRETMLSNSLPYQLNTGFIWDDTKYDMLNELIDSFHKYLEDGEMVRVINDGNQKLQRERTRTYSKSETLKFKKAKNDNTVYGLL